MTHRYYIAEKIFSVFGFIVFCFILWLVFISTWSIPFHMLQTYLFQKQFGDEMRPFHPAQSTLLARAVDFGNFGQSNHCDYFAGEFRSGALSREEIQDAYKNAPLLSFDGSNPLSVDVSFIDDNDMFSRWPLSEWLGKYLPQPHRSVSGKNIYLVYAISAMHPPDGDFRCH